MKNDLLNLPQRQTKPRKYGITSAMDMGLPLAQQQQILESYADLVDLVKIGTGAAYINPIATEKVRMYHDFNIPVCLGGTLFEKFAQQRKLDAYKDYLTELEVDWMEVSSGTLDIPHERLLDVAAEFQQDFTVVAEVGKKFCYSCPTNWMGDIKNFLELGVRYVIMEGRGTGDAGIYNAQGVLERTLIDNITHQIDINKLMFEAPNTQTQIQMIQSLGTNVNLGNVSLHDLVGLEALRVGLRADTFNIKNNI